MYQVKVFNRQTSEVIMESDTFSTLAEADEMLALSDRVRVTTP
jgi:hypothetical protein